MKSVLIVLFSVITFISFFVNNSNYIWATSAGSVTLDIGRSVAIDNDDNYYFIGEIPRSPDNAGTTVDFGNGVTLDLDDGNSVFSIVKYNAANETQWVEGIAANGNPKLVDIVVDNAGAIYVTGYFFHSAIFNGTTTVTSDNFAFSTFIAKYNSEGVFQWVRNTDSPSQSGSVIVLDLATDGNSVYATGYFNDTFTFGNSTISSSGSSDIFISKISAIGTVNWLKGEGGSGGDRGYGIDFNGTNINICGHFRETATIAGNTIDANGATDFFVAQYNTSGTPIWIDHAGSTTDFDRAQGITSNEEGDIFLCGEFGGTMTVGGETVNSTAGTDLFVVKYNSSGVFQWIKQSDGSGSVSPGNIATDGFGEIIAYNAGFGEIDIEGTTLNSSTWQNFLVRYQEDGTFVCVDQLDDFSSSETVKPKIALDRNGHIYVPGHFEGSLTLGDTTLVANGSFDMYISIIGPEPLPVNIVEFKVLQIDNSVLLNWSTYSEINFNKYEIQRKTDQQEFERIGEVKGAGGSSIQNYSFIDKDINANNTIYYRLKMIDLDGSYQYSPIKALNFTPNSLAISVYPNPATNQIFINGLDDNEQYIITISDTGGREIIKLDYARINDGIDISGLKQGIYIIECKNSTIAISDLFILKN